MKTSTVVVAIGAALAVSAGIIWMAAYNPFAEASARAKPSAPAALTSSTASSKADIDVKRMEQAAFQPPPLSSIPDDQFGKVVKLGQQIFEDPGKYAPQYVGNHLSCSNCHLDAGRQAGSAPMWAAYVSYPAYRGKNHKVNTFQDRLQGCFSYSMNGKAPPLDSATLVALESYAYWSAKGAPLDPKIAGRGYPKIAKPSLPADFTRGQTVYEKSCAMCHGSNGQGQRDMAGNPAFPALWGPDSFNWGAGMGSLKNAAPFIKANMPLGQGGSLTAQEAWDVALFMDSHERPQDPRFNGSVAQTRKQFHDSANSMYGKTVNGHLLGQDSLPAGGDLNHTKAKGN